MPTNSVLRRRSRREGAGCSSPLLVGIVPLLTFGLLLAHAWTPGASANPAEPDTDGDGIVDAIDACPNTIPQIPVALDGCPPVIPADFDRDGDVDNADLASFNTCRSGPSVAQANETCLAFDLDVDSDVDQDDFGSMQICYRGENNLADPNCLNP